MKNTRRGFLEQIWRNANQYAANKNSVLEKLCIRLQYFYTPLSKIFDHCAARGSKPLTKRGMKSRCKNFRVIDATHPEKSVYFLSKGQTMKTFWREFTALSVSVCESILHSIGFLKFLTPIPYEIWKCRVKSDELFVYNVLIFHPILEYYEYYQNVQFSFKPLQMNKKNMEK